MGKKKKDTMELRFYDVPQNEYVLALVGESWIREYGHDEPNMHFHNLYEIGYCRDGNGELVLDETSYDYQPGMVSLIPQNYPHTTLSRLGEGPSYWEYLFFDPSTVLVELYPKDEIYQRELLQKISRMAYFVKEEEHAILAAQVKQILDEMREKRPRYRENVNAMLRVLIVELLRLCETADEVEDKRRKVSNAQILPALEYVKNEYAKAIRIEDLAKLCHMSETHFRRIFETSMNMSPMDYINLTRVQIACELMTKTNDSMDIVAGKVGFATTSTFNRNFKKFLNTSPYQWKISPDNYEGRLLNYNISALKGW
ncbi:MAG: helix-turn-helix transcriptional regulator [Roseburia sp.]|nr:helix-turn-helix transcriptional regulator [Roseburia sp.]